MFVNMYEAEKEILPATIKTVGLASSNSNKNATVKAEIAKAKINEIPLDVVSIFNSIRIYNLLLLR